MFSPTRIRITTIPPTASHGVVFSAGPEDREVVRHEVRRDGDRDDVVEHLRPGRPERGELVERVPREGGGAAGLRVAHRPLGVGGRGGGEDDPAQQEDDRRQAERERGGDAERVVDRGADVAVGGREERRRAEDALEARLADGDGGARSETLVPRAGASVGLGRRTRLATDGACRDPRLRRLGQDPRGAAARGADGASDRLPRRPLLASRLGRGGRGGGARGAHRCGERAALDRGRQLRPRRQRPALRAGRTPSSSSTWAGCAASRASCGDSFAIAGAGARTSRRAATRASIRRFSAGSGAIRAPTVPRCSRSSPGSRRAAYACTGSAPAKSSRPSSRRCRQEDRQGQTAPGPPTWRRPLAAARDQPWIETISGMIRIATMFVILIIGLIAGPAVSL